MALSANSVFERVDSKTGKLSTTKASNQTMESVWAVDLKEADQFMKGSIETFTEKQALLKRSNRLFKITTEEKAYF